MKLNLNYFNMATLTLSLFLNPMFSILCKADPEQDTNKLQSCEQLKNDENYSKEIECFEKLTNVLGQSAQSYFNLAKIYYSQGQYIKAKRAIEKYRKLDKEQKDTDPSRLGFAANLEGLSYFELGLYWKAKESFIAAKKEFEKLSPSPTVTGYLATTNLNIGDTYAKIYGNNHNSPAPRAYQDVLKDLLGQADCQEILSKQQKLDEIGTLYKILNACVSLAQISKTQENEKALYSLLELVKDASYETKINTADPITQALIYNYVAKGYEILGKIEESTFYFEKSNEIILKNDKKTSHHVKIMVFNDLGNLYQKQKSNLGKAITLYQEIIDMTINSFIDERNSMKEPLSISEKLLQDQIIENNIEVYENLLTLLWETNQEKSKNEAIFKIMESARTSTNENKSLKQTQEKIPDNAVLIEYFVTKDKTFVMLIDHRNRATVSALRDSSQENIKKAIDQFYQYDLVEKGQSCNTKPCYPESLKTLYKILFQPIKNEITANNLIIIPHGLLRYVPFSALNDDQNKYLIQNYSSITMLPYANFLFDSSQTKQTELIKRRKKIKVVALANPVFDLPYSQKEVQSIQKNASYELKNPLYGQNATFEKLKAQLEENAPDILHLSTHNTLASRIPQDTNLTLSGKDKDLHINDINIYNLPNLDTIKLVILSACQTDTGEITKGDDVFNLTHAFLESVSGGVPSIVTTLWKIDDAASSQLMEQFYKNLAQGMSKAEALQKAQQTILSQADYSHPYYWAAFLLTGDSKPIIENPKP